MFLYQTLAYTVQGKMSYQSNEFKTSSPTWNEESELPDGSYSVSDIQDYFKRTFQRHEAVTDNSSIMIYSNKIENRITLRQDLILNFKCMKQ